MSVSDVAVCQPEMGTGEMNSATSDTKTFGDFDKFGLEPFASQLTRYLLVDAAREDGSYVLSLNSEFGSGKTTFFEMWANKLRSGEDPLEVVYLNAWESDFQGDPLLAVVTNLLDQLRQDDTRAKAESIKETAGKLGKFALSIGNDVVERFTGVNVIEAGQYAERGKEDAKAKLGHICFELYHQRQALFEELKSSLRDLTQELERPTIVLVDELDRCRPSYAIEFLETIKHFFDIKGLVFVLGVDKKQLASSAKCLFGQELDFDEYYRKFAHRNVMLPVKSPPVTARFCRALAQDYFSQKAFAERKRFSYIKHDQYCEDNIVELCNAFSLNARQIHELFRIASHVFSATQKPDSHLTWGFHVATLFMATLCVKNHTMYHRIGRREMSIEEFTTFLNESRLCATGDGFWWAALLYVGAFGDENVDKLKDAFIQLGVWDASKDEEEAFQEELRRFLPAYSSWHGPRHFFFDIYTVLEDLKAFAED